jgi:hypothetical protein
LDIGCVIVIVTIFITITIVNTFALLMISISICICICIDIDIAKVNNTIIAVFGHALYIMYSTLSLHPQIVNFESTVVYDVFAWKMDSVRSKMIIKQISCEKMNADR